MMLLGLLLAMDPVRYELPTRYPDSPDHLLPVRSSFGLARSDPKALLETVLSATWSDHRRSVASLSVVVNGRSGSALQQEPRAFRITRRRTGGVIEGAMLTREGAPGLYDRLPQAQRAAGDQGLSDEAIRRLAASVTVETCEAPLSADLTDRWIDAVNARLVRTRTGLVPIDPEAPAKIGMSTSYNVHLYGAASGYYTGLQEDRGDIARLDLLIGSTFAYCMDPQLGPKFVERAVADLASRSPR